MAKSMMIVDDSATMRKIVKRMVRMSGLHVDRTEEAGNGIEALDKLGQNPVDVILCDMNMPKMGGTEFVKRVREHDAYRHIKIAMVSTESSEDFINDLLSRGADGYISKPFTPRKFEDGLAPLLNAFSCVH